MIMKVIIIGLVAVLAALNSIQALKCYACAGTTTSDCAQGKNSSIAVQQCANFTTYGFSTSSENFDYEDTDDDSRFQSVCVKMFITDYRPKLLIRSCAFVPARVDPCAFLQKHAHVQGCKSCNADLCNNQRFEGYEPIVNTIF